MKYKAIFSFTLILFAHKCFFFYMKIPKFGLALFKKIFLKEVFSFMITKAAFFHAVVE